MPIFMKSRRVWLVKNNGIEKKNSSLRPAFINRRHWMIWSISPAG